MAFKKKTEQKEEVVDDKKEMTEEELLKRLESLQSKKETREKLTEVNQDEETVVDGGEIKAAISYHLNRAFTLLGEL